VLVIETNVTPPLELELAGAAGGEGDGGPLLALVRPTVRGDVAGFPVRWAPAGEAIAGLGSVVFVGVLLLALYGAWSLLRG